MSQYIDAVAIQGREVGGIRRGKPIVFSVLASFPEIDERPISQLIHFGR